MSVNYTLQYRQAKKRTEQLKGFLIELDSICDKLYNRLEFSGVWEALMKLEDVRVKYYVEFHENDRIIKLKGKHNG